MNVCTKQETGLKPVAQKHFNFTGTLFTVVVSVGFVWAAAEWFALAGGPKNELQTSTASDAPKAYFNLKSISQAQSEYIKTDWDKDGKKTYAGYYTHLWTSVDLQSNPILIDLLPRKLAFAIDPARAIDNYYFVNLQDRSIPTTGEIKPLDYEKEWAVMAAPLGDGRAEMLHLLADSSGRIYAKFARYAATQYIDDPAANGWTVIDSLEQLVNIQKQQTSAK
ncbi:MAG: hypothetical protein LLF76_13825 [Planctomycetaceae bacterium]|nr:hypothetical protein [Planctomycetaceae bacterium]